MKIQWLGHDAFLIITAAGTKILTDPYEAGAYDGAVGYKKITVAADIVTQSHQHPDHASKDLMGNPTVVATSGRKNIKDVEIVGVDTFHDQSQGKDRGKNIVFCLKADSLLACHLGDLGHLLDKTQIAALGKVDVLLLPVGGLFTIDANEATKIMEALNPPLTIPMHFKTKVLGFPIAGVEDFLKGKNNVKRVGSSEIEITKETLPKKPEIMVLDHAL